MLWKDKSRRVVPKGGTTLRYPLPWAGWRIKASAALRFEK
jgi:hypothetical protein